MDKQSTALKSGTFSQTKSNLSLAGAFSLLAMTCLLNTSCNGFSGQSSSGPASALNGAGNGSGSLNGGSLNGGSTGGGSTGGGTVPTAAWQALDFSASISGGSSGNVQVVALDKTTKELLVRLPMLIGGGLDGMTMALPIPQMGGAKLGLETLSTGGTALTLRVPLKNLMRGITTGMAAGRLPNGDPIPSIASGEMPALAVPISASNNVSAMLYMSQAVVGMFVSSPVDPRVMIGYPIKNGPQTYGTFTMIPAKSSTVQGGFLMTIKIPDNIARVIDDNI